MLDWYARLVTRSPWRTIAVIVLVTAAMLPGVALTTEEPDAMGSFVPAGSDLARAVDESSYRRLERPHGRLRRQPLNLLVVLGQ